MAIDVTASPIEIIVTQLGDPAYGLDVTASPIVISTRFTGGSYVSQRPAPRNPDLDITYYCDTTTEGIPQGIPVLTVDVLGSWMNLTIYADPIEITMGQRGSFVEGVIVDSSPIGITIGIPTDETDIFVEAVKQNWVAWSDIGHLDFTITRGNVAGRRPLDWQGWIGEIKKLGNKVVVYGENGVSILTPAGNTYGLNTIYTVGLKSRQAVTGNDKVHYFIDNKNQLFKLSDTLEKLDYSEYLAGLTNPVLSMDEETGFVYICDEVTGYIYSPDSSSLGQGPPDITGMALRSGVLMVVAPDTPVTTPTFEICTDIYDFGTRRGKNIYSVEAGTDLTGTMLAAIDYRLDKSQPFAQTAWQPVDRRGIAYIPCYGKEFRFRLRLGEYAYMELDYFEVRGEFNDN